MIDYLLVVEILGECDCITDFTLYCAGKVKENVDGLGYRLNCDQILICKRRYRENGLYVNQILTLGKTTGFYSNGE